MLFANKSQHRPYNKLDGVRRLKLLEETGRLGTAKTEKFGVCSLQEAEMAVFDLTRKTPLLLRTSSLKETTYDLWCIQPNAKFQPLCEENFRKIELGFARFKEEFKDVRSYKGGATILLLNLPNAEYRSTGMLTAYHDSGTYYLWIKNGAGKTEAIRCFREDKQLAYEEHGKLGKDGIAYVNRSQEHEVVGITKEIEAVRAAYIQFAKEFSKGDSEASWVTYGGNPCPVFYDWIRTGTG
ncbi:MAG: hypothetical protein WCT52_05180 [Candidatus Micrarchaeia archaeon]